MYDYWDCWVCALKVVLIGVAVAIIVNIVVPIVQLYTDKNDSVQFVSDRQEQNSEDMDASQESESNASFSGVLQSIDTILGILTSGASIIAFVKRRKDLRRKLEKEEYGKKLLK